jgi:hypothetical protein
VLRILALIAVILLSLAGYSFGVVIKTGAKAVPKPVLPDLITVAFIWAAALYSRPAVPINPWILPGVWLVIALLIGWAATALFGRPRAAAPESRPVQAEHSRKSAPWRDFTLKAGTLQSEIILAFFYFLIFAPFALAVKALSDPLDIKLHPRKSYWLPKKPGPSDLESFKRQS